MTIRLAAGATSRRAVLRTIVVAAGVAPLVSLAACGGRQAATPALTPTSARPQPSPTVSPASLVFTTWGVPPLPEGTATEKAVAAFQSANPTVKVTIEAVPNGPIDAILTKVHAMMASGTPPDVTLMRPNYIATLYAAKSLQSIDPFMAREKALSRDSYFKGALARLIFANQLYGLPSDYWFTVLYYNRDAFQSAGVTPPDAPWSWDAFLSAAQKLTVGTGATTRFGTSSPEWQIRVRDNGGDILDAKETTCLLDQGPAIDAIQWTADLVLKQHVAPTGAEQKVQNAQDRFDAGNLPMYPQGNYFQGIASSRAKFHWDLAPLPMGAAGRRPLAGGANFCMPAGIKNPEASWLFLRYMGGPEGATFRGQDAGLFPPLPALAKPEIIPQFSAAQIHNILASGQDAIPLPFVAKYAQMDKIISAGLAPVWQGQATAKEATAKLVPQVNALLQG